MQSGEENLVPSAELQPQPLCFNSLEAESPGPPLAALALTWECTELLNEAWGRINNWRSSVSYRYLGDGGGRRCTALLQSLPVSPCCRVDCHIFTQHLPLLSHSSLDVVQESETNKKTPLGNKYTDFFMFSSSVESHNLERLQKIKRIWLEKSVSQKKNEKDPKHYLYPIAKKSQSLIRKVTKAVLHNQTSMQ